MLGKPKQQRSQDRINKILQAAESILEHESTDALTIAKISEMAVQKSYPIFINVLMCALGLGEPLSTVGIRKYSTLALFFVMQGFL